MSGFEVLGAVAAAGQLIEQGAKVVKFIKALHAKISDGPNDAKGWIGEIESFIVLAEQVRSSCLHTDDMEKILLRSRGYVEKLHAVLEGLAFEPGDSVARRTWRALCTIHQEDDIRKLLQTLEREKSLLTPLITVKTSSIAQSRFDAVDTRLDELKRSTTPAWSEGDRCLHALFQTDPTADRASLLTNKGAIVPGTCDWITESPQFDDWMRGKDGLLWISGGPGLGKTMLSIFLTEKLEAATAVSSDDHGEHGKHPVVYFFCINADNRRNNPVSILRGLLTQLLRHTPSLITHILPSYKIQQGNLFDQASFETLWAIFLSMVNDSALQKISCVLDGLDECEPAAALEAFLTKIDSLASKAPRLGLIIVSREYPKYLHNTLGLAPRIRLNPDHKTEVNAGLEAYITKSTEELQTRGCFPSGLTEKIKQTLRERSRGTFLWVSFVVKDLQGKEATEVEDCLQQLPEGLDEIYARILNQVNDSRREIVRRTLRWCAFAARPLALWELAMVLGTNASGTLSAIDVARGYVAYCGHFLSVAKSDRQLSPMEHYSLRKALDGTSYLPLTRPDFDVVELVHQSAKDFLIKNSPTIPGKTATWLTPLEPEREHSILASECLAFITVVEHSGDSDMRQNITLVKHSGGSYMRQNIGISIFATLGST